MNSLVRSLLLTATVAVASHAADSIEGNWQVHASVAGNESDQTCAFAVKENALSGTCKGARGTFEVSGKVDGTKVTWTYKIDYEGNPLTINYAGTIAENKVTGTSMNTSKPANGEQLKTGQ